VEALNIFSAENLEGRVDVARAVGSTATVRVHEPAHLVSTPHPAGLDGLLTDVAAVPASRQAWAVGTAAARDLGDRDRHAVPRPTAARASERRADGLDTGWRRARRNHGRRPIALRPDGTGWIAGDTGGLSRQPQLAAVCEL
jgi:hypothetical protein